MLLFQRLPSFTLFLYTFYTLHVSANSLFETDISDFTSLVSPAQNPICKELGPQLSRGAAIYLPSSTNFVTLTDRWQKYQDPNISVVVEVASESDVQKTILYANKYGIPFLAVNRGHGAISSLANLQNGIQISLGLLNDITVSSDGTSAAIGGGVYNYDLVETLFPLNKEAVSGVCSCTGLMGAALGGGHGYLQGKHGLALDNIIAARLVIADGSVIIVSKTSNPDLFWAIRGAGHNFGIVTQITYKIFDITPGATWAYETFIFGHDQVERVFTAINNMTGNGMQPYQLMNYAVILRIPEVDPVNPVVLLSILYDGSASDLLPYSLPFHALSPLSTLGGEVDYPTLANVTSNDLDSTTCAHGSSRLKFPVGAEVYNITAQRQAFDYFAQITAAQTFLNETQLLFEEYSLEAMKAVPADSTAFPHRQDNILMTPEVVYIPDPAHDAAAVKFGTTLRTIFEQGNSGKPLHAYVNYAHGDESLEAMYGGKWRQEKLQALKAKYDPTNRFRWYAPIIGGSKGE